MLHTPRSFERAKSYLDLQLTRPSGPAGITTSNEGPFVTLSREAGAGAPEFAQSLAGQLNAREPDGDIPWTVFDQSIVERVLEDQNLSPRLARFLPEDRVPDLAASVGEIIGLHPNLWTLVQRTNRLMRELARRGRVILVGRGANFATAGIRGGVHGRLVAPEDQRALRIATARNITLREGQTIMRQIDSQRRHYVRSVFDTDVATPAAYDITINTGRVPSARIIAILTSMVEKTAALAGG